MKTLKVQLLLTGNELMTGDIVDSNSAMIAKQLKELGLEISRKVTIADHLEGLSEEIEDMAKRADILIINGGLGPTVDDLTAQALAQTISKPLTLHSDALKHLEQWAERRKMTLSKANLKQAILPEHCDIIANKIGSAVGFKVNHHGCDIYCTPGVPHELKTMMLDEIRPEINLTVQQFISKHQLPRLIYDVSRLQVFGLGESTLQTMINEQLPLWPDHIELGFRAGNPILEVKLTIQSEQGLKEKEHWTEQLSSLLGDHLIDEVVGEPISLAEHVIKQLEIKNKVVSTAESCTGGLIASMLTRVSGSSSGFHAGFVTYSNDIKEKVIHVPEEVISRFGAVSEETVIAMAEGALAVSQSDLTIAVTGIAGPTGGSELKPVGMVWVAWGAKEDLKTACLYIPLERRNFQQYVASMMLDLIRRELKNSQETPHYIVERKFSAKLE
jgi:nicotinamide-nucleotide amidase